MEDMMKILWLMLLFAHTLLADVLMVKEGNVTLLINGEVKDIKQDQSITLTEGSMVCLIDGNGIVSINKRNYFENKTNNCFQLPLKDNFNLEKFISSNKSSIAILPTHSKKTEGFVLSKEAKELIVYSKTYAPLPIRITVTQANGKIIKEFVNQKNPQTFFRIPTLYIKDLSRIEISNAFGEILLDTEILKQSKKDTVLHKGIIIPPQQKNIEGKHSKVFYEKGNHTIVDILYGTDRKMNPKEDFEDYYNGNRGNLQFGIAQVSIPKKHEFGEMERPNPYLFWEKEKIGEHVVVVKLENITKNDFSQFLGNKLQNVSEKDILIFIHGFNVTFASAIRRTAQLSYDLKFKGVPITYSWPSAGKTSEYMKDESSVQYTTPHLVTFLKEIIEHRNGANIHIIGHSMGTRALTNAIKEISFVYPGKHVFKNIILAAPDIDRDVFEVNLFPYIKKTTDQITLYASSDDSALKVSNTLHGGTRVGQGDDGILVFKGLTTVDATGVDTSLLGHSYFAEKEIIVTDLKDLILKSLPPQKREKTLIQKLKDTLVYWKIKIK